MIKPGKPGSKVDRALVHERDKLLAAGDVALAMAQRSLTATTERHVPEIKKGYASWILPGLQYDGRRVDVVAEHVRGPSHPKSNVLVPDYRRGEQAIIIVTRSARSRRYRVLYPIPGRNDTVVTYGFQETTASSGEDSVLLPSSGFQGELAQPLSNMQRLFPGAVKDDEVNLQDPFVLSVRSVGALRYYHPDEAADRIPDQRDAQTVQCILDLVANATTEIVTQDVVGA